MLVARYRNPDVGRKGFSPVAGYLFDVFPVSLLPGRGTGTPEGRAGRSSRYSPAALFREYQVYWGVVQAEDVNRGNNARLCS